MPEVHARFEQLLHGNVSQSTSSFGLHRSLALRLLPIAIPVPAPRSTGRIEHLKNQPSAISLQPKTLVIPSRSQSR
jgi:hypothetical protein